MKTTISILFGFALLCTSLFSAEDTSNVSFKSNLLSQYVDSDGQIYYSKPVLQSELTVSLPHGFYLDLWHSGQANGKSGDGTELETSLGLAKEGVVSVDVGVSYYDLSTLFHGPKNDLYVAYLKASKAFEYNSYGSLKPALELTHYKSGRGSDFEGGFRAKFSAEYSHKLFDSNFTYTASLVRDNGTFGMSPAWVTGHEVSLDWKWGKAKVKFPTMVAYVPLSAHSERKTTVVGGMGIAYDF